jgi:hypothetical protein
MKKLLYFLQFIFFLSLNFLVCDLFAQNLNHSSLAPTDVWNQSVNNQRAVKVYMKGEIKNSEGKLLVELRSSSFILKQGINQLSNEWIQTTKTDWHDDAAKHAVVSTGNFPKGTYQVCAKIFESSNDRELANPCRTITVDELLIRKNDPTKYKNISAYGSASIDYTHNSPQSYYSDLPTNFVRVEAEQGLSIYSFPISGMFRYTTEKTEIKKDVDMFTLRFDRNRFERNVKELILRKVVETQLKKVKLNETDLKSLTEFEELEKKYTSEAYLRLNEEIAKIGRELQTMGKETAMSATSQYRTELKRKYESLLEQKKKFDILKSRYDQLKKLHNTWIASGRLDELKNLAYAPPDLTDPKAMIGYLRQYGAYTGMNKFLFNIKELSIGTTYPVYSPLTLNGTQIFGGNFEWNPGIFFLGASAGKIQSSIPFALDTSNAQFRQKMAALRVGLGKAYGSHIYFTGAHFWDLDDTTDFRYGQEFYPESAWLGSSDFMISIGKKRVVELSGEVAGLFRNQNTRDTLAPVFNLQSQFVEKNLKPNLSSSFDIAANSLLKFNLFNGNSQLEIGSQFVGPGFIHPGAFGLRNDVWRKDARWIQQLNGNKLKLTGKYITERDNFSDAKSITTNMNQYGVDVDLNYSKFPQTRISIDRINLKNTLYTYQTNLINLLLNKNFKISKKSSANTVMNGMYYFTKTDSLNQNIHSYYIAVQQSFSLPAKISLQLGGQYAKNAVATVNTQITSYNINVGKLFFKKVKLTAGANYYNNVQDNKLGYLLDISGNLIRNMQLNCRAYRNNYSQYPGIAGQYRESYVLIGLRYSW